MSHAGQSSFGREISRRLLKAGIAVAGLLLIRFILGRLPMVAHADPIYIDSLFGTDQAVVSPTAIAKAIIDTLIFAVVLFAAVDAGALVRSSARRLPEAGMMIMLTTVVVVVALAYSSYSTFILPIIGDQSIYDWSFLVLGVLPVAGLVLLVYRNLDVITDVVYHSSRHAVSAVTTGHKSASVACANCGSVVVPGARFCASCGKVVSAAPAVAVPDVFCSVCGTKNAGGADSCTNCGKPLAKVPV